MDINKIEETRIKLGIKKTVLSKRTGMARGSYEAMLAHGNPTISTIEKISEAMGVSPAYWWEGQIEAVDNNKLQEELRELKRLLERERKNSDRLLAMLEKYEGTSGKQMVG